MQYKVKIIYNGIEDLTGMHKHDILDLSDKQVKMIKISSKSDNIIPEDYILMLNNFDNSANNTIDEWMYYLKNTAINSGFSAQGLQKARQVLDVTNLSKEERLSFESYIDNWRVRESTFKTAWLEGKMQGEREIAMAFKLERNTEIALNVLPDS
jgi:hypothetical protein